MTILLVDRRPFDRRGLLGASIAQLRQSLLLDAGFQLVGELS
jgi:hypothetical protein